MNEEKISSEEKKIKRFVATTQKGNEKSRTLGNWKEERTKEGSKTKILYIQQTFLLLNFKIMIFV